MLVSLGGPAGDGNFRLDYIPSLTVQAGPCSSPRTLPGFGFVFTATVQVAGFVAAFDISLPTFFGIDTSPAEGGILEFATLVLPFDAVGSACHESQGIDPVLVRATTPFGAGADVVAATVRTNVACNTFGSGLTTISCPSGTPAAGAVPAVVSAGLGAMVSNTLNFHHRTTRGGSVSPSAGMYLRARNADLTMTTTRLMPAAASDCPNALDTTPGRPPMCMIDLLVLE
jgi:hypothetical protein